MPVGRPSSAPRVRRSDTARPVLSARAGAALGVLVVLIAILAIPFKEWITQRARISYQTGGITWWADYNLIFTEGADANSGRWLISW